jgi:formylglycine-generating enzyme required for sulfatase activity
MMTIGQYRKIMGSGTSGAAFVNAGDNVQDWCPVGAPSYNTLRGSKVASASLGSNATSASIFERLNALTGLNGGFDLPTEVMWEIAHRAGTTTMYWWRDSYIQGDVVASIHCNDNRTKNGTKTQIFRVGAYNSNSWGLYDTMGNLLELCRDVGCYGDLADAPDAFTPKYDSGSVLSMARGNYWEVGAGNGSFKSSARTKVWSIANLDASLGKCYGFRVFFVAP